MTAWGILSLADPITGEVCADAPNAMEILRFRAGAPLFEQAQEAYQRSRADCQRLCVAAQGGACGVAVSLAAQLPVELLALRGGNIFGRATGVREIDRLNAFARRNLALIASEILLMQPSNAEERGFVRGIGLQPLKITCDFSGNVYNTICDILRKH